MGLTTQSRAGVVSSGGFGEEATGRYLGLLRPCVAPAAPFRALPLPLIGPISTSLRRTLRVSTYGGTGAFKAAFPFSHPAYTHAYTCSRLFHDCTLDLGGAPCAMCLTPLVSLPTHDDHGPWLTRYQRLGMATEALSTGRSSFPMGPEAGPPSPASAACRGPSHISCSESLSRAVLAAASSTYGRPKWRQARA